MNKLERITLVYPFNPKCEHFLPMERKQLTFDVNTSTSVPVEYGIL